MLDCTFVKYPKDDPAEGLIFRNRKGTPLSLDNLRSRHFREVLKTARITREVRPAPRSTCTRT